MILVKFPFVLPLRPSLLPILERQNQGVRPRDSIFAERQPVHPPLQKRFRSRAFGCIEHTNRDLQISWVHSANVSIGVVLKETYVYKIRPFISGKEDRSSAGATMIPRHIVRRLIRLQRPKWNFIGVLSLFVEADIDGGNEAPALELRARV